MFLSQQSNHSKNRSDEQLRHLQQLTVLLLTLLITEVKEHQLLESNLFNSEHGKVAFSCELIRISRFVKRARYAYSLA